MKNPYAVELAKRQVDAVIKHQRPPRLDPALVALLERLTPEQRAKLLEDMKREKKE